MKRLIALFVVVALAACAETPTQPEGPALQPEAQMARTQSNEWIDYNYNLWNQCTNEYMAFDGRYHYVVGQTSDGSGGWHYSNHLNLNMTATGLSSGDSYRWQYSQNRSLNVNGNNGQFNDRYDLTYRFKTKSGPDFTYNYGFTFVVNANGDVVHDTSGGSFTCS